MYENGKQLNRYANKMLHKRKMKQSYLKRGYFCFYSSWSSYIANLSKLDSVEYWKTWYLTGAREYADYKSRKKIRQSFRQDIHRLDFDDIHAPQHSEYKKLTEYWWVIY